MQNQIISVRKASTSDISALHTLVNSAYRGESSRLGWTTEADLLDGQRTDLKSLRQFLANDVSHRLLVLCEGTRIRACVCLELRRESQTCYLGMLTVSPTAQNRGFGKILLDASEREAATWGATRMTISVIHQRRSLIDWYKRNGYQETGERQEFPYGKPEFGIPKRQDLFFELFEKPLPL